MARVPGAWLEACQPDRLPVFTAAETPVQRAERGLEVPVGRPPYCPTCLRRVPPERTTRRRYREVCASGPIDVWLSVCTACGCTLAAHVAMVPDEA